MICLTLIGLLSLIFAAPSWAEEDPVAKGEAIAHEADLRDRGFHDTQAKLRMTLVNRAGQKSERQLRVQTLEVLDANDGDKSLVVFDQPRDIKGTALLSYSHILEPDDQWLYLPALKRVKRISSNNKSGPFVGSEFAYEDMVSQELQKYDYKWLRDEPCGSLECFVVQLRPRYENSGYTRQVTWYDKDEYRPVKIEYFDRKDALLKRLTFNDYRQYLGKYWRAHDLLMVNQQSGKQTRVVIESIEFQTGLTEADFTRSSLERAR
jgi:outer membrane lipoprotein-sorting protein